jgi:hypothetical protein
MNPLDDDEIMGAETASASTEAQTKEPPRTGDLLEEAFSFLDSAEELNPLLCGYFAKLATGLLKYKRQKF